MDFHGDEIMSGLPEKNNRRKAVLQRELCLKGIGADKSKSGGNLVAGVSCAFKRV
jgi:hypothetical protein